MASVRVEGFPSPDAKTMMESMVKGESEKILADLSEDERQEREIAFGTNQSVGKVDKMLQELVGDVQLAVEEEPMEAIHVKDMFQVETEMVSMTSLRAKLRPIAREESTLVEQECDVVHRKGVDIVREQQIMGADKRSLQMRRRLCQRSVVVTDS